MTKHIISLLLSLVLLAGCAPGITGNKVQPQPIEALGIVDLFPAQRTAEKDTAFSQFAVELLRQSRDEGENTLLSPLSVALALGMTSAGAHGETAQAFASLFGLDLGGLASYCYALLEDYRDLGGSTESTLVNSLWCDPDLTLRDEFIITCREYFDAQLYHLDLQDPGAAKAVNNWVGQATRGLIPQVVDSFDDDARLALVNAVYLKNRFERPFKDPTSEWTIDFTAEDGTVTRPKGMGNGTRNETYLSHEGGQGVILPYDDGRLGLLLMLPDQGTTLTDYLATWTGETVKDLLEDQIETKVALTVPKFKTDWSTSLSGVLSAMGLEEAFDPDRADFTRMGTTASGYPLYIGDVIHKTAFELNEKGTEAAAVTAVIMMEATAMPVQDWIRLRFDRPFVYGIVDLETGTPLFLGTMERCE